MEAFGWLEENFAGLLNAVGIVGGLLFTAFSLRGETKARRLGNLLALTEAHRDIWTRLYEEPDLSRILEKEIDLSMCPVTAKEELFVTFLILHLNCVYRAMNSGMFPKLEGIRRDIRDFYSLPIPKEVWSKLKPLQDRDFVAFVENTFRRHKRRGCVKRFFRK